MGPKRETAVAVDYPARHTYGEIHEARERDRATLRFLLDQTVSSLSVGMLHARTMEPLLASVGRARSALEAFLREEHLVLLYAYVFSNDDAEGQAGRAAATLHASLRSFVEEIGGSPDAPTSAKRAALAIANHANRGGWYVTDLVRRAMLESIARGT